MKIVRIDRGGERGVLADGPISPAVTTAPREMIISVMGNASSARGMCRYEAVFGPEDMQFTRAALERAEPRGPTLRGLARERRALWVLCPMCGRATKVTPYSLADRLGRDASIAAVASQLRCKKCEHRGAALIPDAIAGDLRT